MHTRLISLTFVALAAALSSAAADAAGTALPAKEALGRAIFFDKALSEPAGQACASCHDPKRAFSPPNKGPTSPGAVDGLFGSRNAPSAMYAMYAPPLQAGGEDGAITYFGGQFRDGRVDTLEDQAKGPFLNPLEMANPDRAAVVAKVAVATYADQFKAVYGKKIFNDVDVAYNAVADAIANFERTRRFSPFSAKYDQVQRGATTFTDAEARGLAVFVSADKGNCASCHPTTSHKGSKTNRALFTDFGYDNVGVPPNPALKFYDLPPLYNPDGRNFVDLGLGNVVPRDFTRGQFKAPSLRNVAVTGPYMHNGYFKTLRGVLDFYNTRDTRPACGDRFVSEAQAQQQGCWPAPELADNVNRVDMGNLGLTPQDIDDLLAFLATLTDQAYAGSAEQARQTAARAGAR